MVRGDGSSVFSFADFLKGCLQAFTLRSTWLGVALALLVKIGMGIFFTIIVVHLTQELNWPKERYTSIQGGLGVALGLGGSILGGLLADCVGAKRMAGISTVLLGATWITFGLTPLAWQTTLIVSVFLLLTEFFASVLSVSLFALFMGLCWPAVAATQFTAYMAILNLSNTCGAWYAGRLRDAYSFSEILLGMGIFQIVAILAWLLVIDPHERNRRLAEEQASEQSGDDGGMLIP
jgi:PAT family beta-lactamase induction signal transducer AmpG